MINLEDAKAYLRVDSGDEDNVINDLAEALQTQLPTGMNFNDWFITSEMLENLPQL